MHVWSIALVTLLLGGCFQSTEREIVYDIDACREQNLRAVMICEQRSRGATNCRIECREYADEG